MQDVLDIFPAFSFIYEFFEQFRRHLLSLSEILIKLS